MIEGLWKNGMLALSGLLGAFYLTIAIGASASGDWDSTGERVAFGLIVGLGGLLVFAGLLAGRRSPRLGGALLALGAVIGAVLTFWIVATPIVALLVLTWIILRWRRATPAAG